MITLDAVGYLASGLVFATFCMKGMISLRLVAVCSNVAFINYGLGLDLVPVWLLHAILLPLNCWRLWQMVDAGSFSLRRAAMRSVVFHDLSGVEPDAD